MKIASTQPKMSRPAALCAALGLALLVTAACGSDEENDVCADFSQPQIVPSERPVCVGPVAIPADMNELQPTPRSIVLQNLGNSDLRITDVQLEGDARGHFTLQGVDPMIGTDVTCPDAAAVGILYTPTEPGWDSMTLVIRSNAENFRPEGATESILRVFYLALAVPADDPSYVVPDKPMEAVGADGSETCPDL